MMKLKNIEGLVNSSLLNQESLRTYMFEHPGKEVPGVYLRIRFLDKTETTRDNIVNVGSGCLEVKKSCKNRQEFDRKYRTLEDLLTRYDTQKDPYSYEINFIPCYSRDGAFDVEGYLHQCLNRKGLKYDCSENKKHKSREFFNLEITFENFIAMILGFLKEPPPLRTDLTSRIYQIAAEVQAQKCYKTEESFYLLHKPRAGKNITSAKILINWYKDTPVNGLKIVRWISRWPSAFSGFEDDVNTYKALADQINVINTDDDDFDWDTLDELFDPDKINVVMVSMQSLSSSYNKEAGTEFENFGKHLQVISALEAQFNAYDESDSGMRTELSTGILKECKALKKLWISGTDLYAYTKLANSTNSHIHTLIEEHEYRKYCVKHGIGFTIPIIKTFMFDLMSLVENFSPLTDKLVEDGETSRSLRNLFSTSFETKKVTKYQGRYHDRETGKKITFKYPGAVKSAINIAFGLQASRIDTSICSLDLQHGVVYMPSVASIYALHNYLEDNPIFICGRRLKVIAANQIKGSLGKVDQTRAEIKANFEFHTIFCTVNMLSRGATVPEWDYVLRFDDGMDWKAGHQKDLRSQSNDHLDTVYVFDANPTRAVFTRYEMSRVIAKISGKDHTEVLRQLCDASPIFSFDPSTYKYVEVDFNGIIERVYSTIEVESLADDDIFECDDETLIEIANFLKVGKNAKNNKVTDNELETGKSYIQSKQPSDKARIPKETDKELNTAKAKIKTVVKSLAFLSWFEDGRFYSLETLLEGTSHKDTWLKHVGITKQQLELVISVLDRKFIDERLQLIAHRIERGFVSIFEICNLAKNTSVGDVPLSKELVGQMLDKFTINTWQTLRYWLEVNSYNGEFVLQILERYEANGFTREEILPYIYVAESSGLNAELIKKRVGVYTDHVLVYNSPEELQAQLKDLSMKFDCVVGNPPYNRNLHLDMLRVAYDNLTEDGQLVFVHPAIWLYAQKPGKTRKTSDEIKTLIGNHFKYFEVINGNKAFNIRLFGPCVITHVDKTKTDVKVIVQNNLTNRTQEFDNSLDINPFFDNPTVFNSLRDKIWKHCEKVDNVQNHLMTKDGSYFLNLENIIGDANKEDDNVCVANCFYDFMYVGNKVITDQPVKTKGGIKQHIAFKTKIEAERALKYLGTTKLAKFTLMVVKVGQHISSGRPCRFTPWFDFTKTWTDQAYYEALGLTTEEQAFLEKHVTEFYANYENSPEYNV